MMSAERSRSHETRPIRRTRVSARMTIHQGEAEEGRLWQNVNVHIPGVNDNRPARGCSLGPEGGLGRRGTSGARRQSGQRTWSHVAVEAELVLRKSMTALVAPSRLRPPDERGFCRERGCRAHPLVGGRPGWGAEIHFNDKALRVSGEGPLGSGALKAGPLVESASGAVVAGNLRASAPCRSLPPGRQAARR
jgi:hypothetical protein